METMRDVKRVMEREAAKGSVPLVFERLVFDGKPYRFITSEEKLNEVLAYLLRIRTFGQYAGRTIINNVYMDLDILCKKPQFKRTRSVVEREEIYTKVQRYKRKLKPEYAGKVCLEKVQCTFNLPQKEADRYRISYEGKETYGFPLSNKYILGLFACCEAARKSVVWDGVEYGHLPDAEQKLVLLDGVRDVLFQVLLLDSVSMEQDRICADMCTIMLLE